MPRSVLLSLILFWVLCPPLWAQQPQAPAEAEENPTSEVVPSPPSQTPPAPEEELLPLWEYGIGLGYVRFWHYPASDQTREWALPVPTFQYRGEILRADDREGARAYLLRENNWSLEMGGGANPAIKSQDNHARQGMDDLPWGFQLGPQIVTKFHPEYQFKLGFYQAIISPDLKYSRANGLFSEVKFIWHLGQRFRDTGLYRKAKIRSYLSFSIDAASKEFLQGYYEVPPQDVTPERPEYAAREGLLSATLSFFQSIGFRKHSLYFGAAQEFYEISANRRSPLHRNDRNLNLFAGVTYTLGESERKAIPESKAEGALEKLSEKMHLPFFHKGRDSRQPIQGD